MTYIPDPTRFQQLVLGGATGPVDCTAWAGAWVVSAHTQGTTYLSGRSIRLASSEPVPDPASPGLNDEQVDAAIYRLTSGRVDLDTVRGLSRSQVQARVIDGRWVSLAVKRSVLVDRGLLTGFRGAHRITVHARSIDNAPVIGDPLVAHYVVGSWDAVSDACQAVTPSGTIFAQFSRDLTPDYQVVIHPAAGYTARAFWRYHLDGAGNITGRTRASTGGFTARCTRPVYHPSSLPNMARRLVQLTTGSRKGYWVDARHAEEVYP
jgi:hypothetical protein